MLDQSAARFYELPFLFTKFEKIKVMSLNCLQNIVGTTLSDNACIVQGLTSDQLAQLKNSTSGLYLDDLPGGVHMKALTKSDSTKSFYDMTQAALTNAAKVLEDDLIVELSKNYKKSRNNFIGPVGQMSFAQNLAVTGQWQGVRLRPVDYSDAVIKLNRITLVVNVNASFFVYLYKARYKSTTAELVTSWPITTVANAYQFIQATPPTDPLIVLPAVENGEMMEYYIFFDRLEAGSGNPKDNKIACSTCPGSAGVKVSDYINAVGFQSSTLPDLQSITTDSYAHGFILDLEIKCDTEKLFCGNYQADDAVAVTMSRAVWFKAGELLIEDVLKSPDINRYTTMDKERLLGKRNHFRKEYEGRVAFLVTAIDVTASNCYVCRNKVNQPYAAGILS
jgi:hypothetical protein